jgi:hypothetical protein
VPGARPFRVCKTALLLGDPSLAIRSTRRHGAERGTAVPTVMAGAEE